MLPKMAIQTPVSIGVRVRVDVIGLLLLMGMGEIAVIGNR